MKDIRLVATGVALIMSIIGYILLVGMHEVNSAKDLLTLVGLPSLTFIIGIGSSLKND